MNGLNEKLNGNGPVFGTMVSEFHTPNLAVMLKTCGFDFFIVDCEHGYFDYSMVAGLTTAARGADIPIIVRIPEVSRECIVKYLDMGVNGLLIPMVEHAEQLRSAIQYGKYAPEGRRGVSTTRAHTRYHVENLREYMKAANQHTVILAQIESQQGLRQLEEIAGVQGLDGLIVGPNDLAQDLGISGTRNHPALMEAIGRIAAAARTAGIGSGIISSQIDLLQHCERIGMSILSWNSEVGMLMSGAKEGLAKLKRG
ncbi:HpcH/HpaI aldolase family protein [Paenibacillus thalictri]|uniref:HpcH/HpaI aldolase/citrate lyase domain-containing protein n=1 Tax=Paenibacillus thalictri TaxID=2527873 RepID=A0A4Q9DFB3_9BACL|nr:aldolase/citrate lyase family protein [Paenibacillus thalictri]TBL70536.1 hypothetical protein EYB31_32975 [Paenibacillus thalictri]